MSHRSHDLQKSVLITGISGSGKSTICEELVGMGYEAYDIEDMDTMFAMYRKGTREIFTDFDNNDPIKIENSVWLCNIDKLQERLAQQRNSIAFYCGVASNMDDLFPLFNQVFLLRVSAASLHQHLSTRQGTNNMGSTEASRQAVLGWKDWWEKEMETHGAVNVNADDSPRLVAKKVYDLAVANILER